MKTQNRSPKMFYLFALIFASDLAFSQAPQPPPGSPPAPKNHNQQEKRENIEAQKTAFLTKKIDLTPEEAQLFWPVYNQFDGKLQELRKKRRQDIKNAKENFETLTDKEVELLVDNEIVFKQKELDIQKEYHSKFKLLLPIKKVAKFYYAEEEFKRFLLKELKDRPVMKNGKQSE